MANKVVAILGSKTPNIQNLAVGGVANAINLDNQSTLNMTKLYMVKDLLDEVTAFIQQVLMVDVAAVGAMYADWLGYGAGVTNYLAVPEMPLDTKGTQFDMPGGTIFDGDLSTLKPITSFQDAVLPRQRHRGDRALVVRRRLEQAPVGRGHGAQVHGVPGRRPLLVGEGAALPGPADAGGAAGAGAGRLRLRQRARQEVGRLDARDGGRGGRRQAGSQRAALDARAHRRARDPLRDVLGARPQALGPPGRATSPRATPTSSRRGSTQRAKCAGSASTRRRAVRCRTGS